ncbi:MAG: AI-2E family transporter [Lachnospiraceae bacterium]|nr:AI-2E family transporter [Lachnospiraceae bacterium]
MEKEEQENNANMDTQEAERQGGLLVEASPEEGVQGQAVDFQKMSLGNQAILEAGNEQNNSFNWRLTKKNIGSFLVIVLSMIFFFFLFRIDRVGVLVKEAIKVLQPIIVGVVMAYLLNPVEKFVEIRLLKLKKEPGHGYRKFARNMGILLSICIGIFIVIFLVMTVVPQFISSAQEIITELPDKMNKLVNWVNDKFSEDTEFNRAVNSLFNTSITYLENWMQTELLNTLNVIAVSFTSGLISVFNVLKNLFIGIFVAIYVMSSKDHFAKVGRKMCYAFLPQKKASVLFEIMQHCHRTYSGFINGKLIDSFIIGMLCYAGVSFMDLEKYKMLISVIVGVTNVIPFFGPFIGGIPCVVLIMLVDLKKGIYLGIFIILLQQLDGNVIGPMILGDSTGLSPFWVMFAILVGGGLFGFMGMLIGVPTFAVIYYLIKRVVEAKLEKKGMPKDTNQY